MKASFSFTDTDVRSITLPIVEMNTADYAMREDEPSSCTVVNTTTAIDQPELVTYQCGNLKRVPSKVTNLYPPTVETAVQYGVRLDELVRITKEDGTIVNDLPITATLTFKHATNSMITADMVNTVLQRLIGTLYKANNTSRIGDMMRMAIRPKE